MDNLEQPLRLLLRQSWRQALCRLRHLDSSRGIGGQVPALNAPPEEHREGLVVRDERVDGPVPLNPARVEELPHALRCARLNLAHLGARAEQPNRRAVSPDRVRRVAAHVRGVVAELVAENVDAHMAQRKHTAIGCSCFLEPLTGIEPVTFSFAYTSASLQGGAYGRARLYLERALVSDAPLVSRSGAGRHGLNPCGSLTVIRDSRSSFFDRGRGCATHHGDALPTELQRRDGLFRA